MNPTDDQIRAAHVALKQLREHMPRSDWHLDRVADALPPLPPEVEPWNPRTMIELADYWDAQHVKLGAPLQWAVRQRTNDIVKMLKEEAERRTTVDHHSIEADLLNRMAQRILALE